MPVMTRDENSSTSKRRGINTENLLADGKSVISPSVDVSLDSDTWENIFSDDEILYESDTEESSTRTDNKIWIVDTAYDVVCTVAKVVASTGIGSSEPTEELYEQSQAIASATKNSDENEEDSNFYTEISEIDGTWNKILYFINNMSSFITDSADYMSDVLYNFTEYLSGVDLGDFGTVLVGILSAMSSAMSTYEDGVSETSFGKMMSNSWYGNSSTSFLNYFATNTDTYKINILTSTPLDSNENNTAMFGTMILGTPPTFNKIADPNNRTFVNSFVKDCKVVSFTPGLPKYNGSQQTQSISDSIYYQTRQPTSMMSYLLRNGIDKTFSEKDKRYYTFEAKYGEYFAYLETMLNTIWIKMGLGTGSDANEFNIFSFFDIRGEDGSIKPENAESLKSQYSSSIGFYTNPESAISESISNTQTSFGSELASNANTASENYQKLNYLTGMGTGSSTDNLRRLTGVTIRGATDLMGTFNNTFTTALSAASDATATTTAGKVIAKTAAFLLGSVKDIARFTTENDLGATIQQFEVQNGMKVTYPELWSDSSYSKNINLNFSFISPYGDPLSIFKYVYVPFCALLCFGLPRQAASNGYVSPFFVRVDIPGMLTSDLAVISDITWTKGGSNNLWTKDGLPRAIDCTVTISDLYPYLAMTKRMSFLSANPSYTVMLDNMAGMCTISDGSSDDELNEYFKKLVNRVSGNEETTESALWNKFGTAKRNMNSSAMQTARTSVSVNVDTIPWYHNSSL